MLNDMSRDTALRFHYILDQLVPPIIRDCRFIMAIPMWIMFRHRYKLYMDFKEKAFSLTDEEFRDYYKTVSDTAIKRETDLNKACIERIMQSVENGKILDVGCGRGFLVNLLSQKHNDVSGIDIYIPDAMQTKFPQLKFYEGSAEKLPFPDKHFDTVICTHTLEHVRNLAQAIAELRRVAKKLIIIVPKQRPYKYTFDLHLNFFPYIYSFLSMMEKTKDDVTCESVDDDIFYMETVK